MKIEEMKTLWDSLNTNSTKSEVDGLPKTDDLLRLDFQKKASIFTISEILGIIVAYILAAFIVFEFAVMDIWYLQVSSIVVVLYLLVMPVYTIYGTFSMKKFDLETNSYKAVMEHFYAVKRRLKIAETISFMASPFLFIAAIAIFTKVFIDKDLFIMQFQFYILFLFALVFAGATIFNIWAFKKRENTLQSVNQLLEEHI